MFLVAPEIHPIVNRIGHTQSSDFSQYGRDRSVIDSNFDE